MDLINDTETAQTHSHRVISASSVPLLYPSATGVLAAELLVLRVGAPVDGQTLWMEWHHTSLGRGERGEEMALS